MHPGRRTAGGGRPHAGGGAPRRRGADSEAPRVRLGMAEIHMRAPRKELRRKADVTAVPAGPCVVITQRGAARLKAGHVWVYRSDVVSAEGVAPGSVVSVADERKKVYGWALYSSSSQIAVRMISAGPVADFPELLRERLRQAITYREPLLRQTDAYRVVFSEGDFLPGLIVDRYNDILSLQSPDPGDGCGANAHGAVAELTERLRPAAIAERVDPHIRELEQLPAKESGLLLGEKTNTDFCDEWGAVSFRCARRAEDGGVSRPARELRGGGAVCPRRGARRFLLPGGVCAAPGGTTCCKVTGVDSSRPALEIADKNALLNQRDDGVDRGERVRPAEGLLRRRAAVRHDRARSAGLRQDEARTWKRRCAGTRNSICGR